MAICVLVLGLIGAAPGEALLQQTCAACHPLDVVRAQTLTRWEWSRELDKMSAMGAKIRRRRELLNYLAKTYGKKRD